MSKLNHPLTFAEARHVGREWIDSWVIAKVGPCGYTTYWNNTMPPPNRRGWNPTLKTARTYASDYHARLAIAHIIKHHDIHENDVVVSRRLYVESRVPRILSA